MDFQWLKNGIKDLSPVYFGLPMSTGIIAIASFVLGYQKISDFLFLLNNIELILLSILFLSRLFFYVDRIKEDLSSTRYGAGFLTLVAALCILGTKNVMLRDNLTIALIGWSVTFGIWLIILYGFVILTMVKSKKDSIVEGINGSWLLFVVSAQALSISGNLVAAHFDFAPRLTLFITSGLYLLGGLFYVVLIGLIIYRFLFFPLKAEDFRPSYWINMGAAAISTLAGAILIKSMDGLADFEVFIPVIKVFTVFYWVSGTWWIPVLVFLEIWKRLKIRVRYYPGYWSLVFPLGVYTLCTWQMADVLGLTGLKRLPQVTVFIAWIAWGITYVQMLWQVLRALTERWRIDQNPK